MKIVTCKNGHRFNIDKYQVCPTCGQAANTYSDTIGNKDQRIDVPPDHIKHQLNEQTTLAPVKNKKRQRFLILCSSLIVGGIIVCVIMGILLFNRMSGNDKVLGHSSYATEESMLAEQDSTAASTVYSVNNDEELNMMRTDIKDGDSFEINHVLLSYDDDVFSLSYDGSDSYPLSLTAEKFDLLLYHNRIVSMFGVYDGQYKVYYIRSEKIIIDNKEDLMDFSNIKIHKYEESASVKKCEIFYDAIALNEYCIKFDDMNFGFMVISNGSTDLSVYEGKKVDCTITIKENTANYGGEYATEDYWELNSIDHVY